MTQLLAEGACDCHVHVIGPQAVYPMAEARHYTPDLASVQALQRHLAGLGLQRVVVVQPSVYGTDNRCLLDALAALPGTARGIAVLDDAVPASSLRDLHARGVRGVRLNLESAGQRDAAGVRQALRHGAARVADLGWHLQVYAAEPVLLAVADTLADLPAPVVLDHFAMVQSLPQPRHGVLVELLQTGRVHLKLSAAYRLAAPTMADVWAQRLAEAAPGALLWGSDWPHTARTPGHAAHAVSAYRQVPAATLHDALMRWLPDAGLRRRVLVDNPASLYGW